MGTALALPPPMVSFAPVVQVVAVSAGGGRMRACCAVTREEAPGRGFSAVWVVFFAPWGLCVPVWFGSVVLYPVCTRLFKTPFLFL